MRFRPVLLALGTMTSLLGAAMVPCALIDLADGAEAWQVFAASSFGAIFVGVCLSIMAGGKPPRTGQREAFLLTVLVWVVLPAIAAIPFLASGMTLTNAMFESISGLTTTGATILVGLDEMPRGLLLWRAILQWIGGIGIIVTAIAILPQLRVGGMQLFQIESSDQSGKFLPRVTEIAAQTGIVYLIFSAACAFSYLAVGMSGFDAIAHSMTTMSAGGFSTHDASFGHFAGTNAGTVAIIFMFIAGLPFSLLSMALLQGRLRFLFTDPQPRLYAGFIVFFTATIVAYQFIAFRDPVFDGVGDGIGTTLFNVISIMTGTGYASAPYDTWGDPVVMIFLVLTFLGGCAGSAACGIKMFRIEIAMKSMFAYAGRMTKPHARIPVRYGGRVVGEDTLQSVMVFVFLYLTTFMVAAALLALTGLDPLTSISASAASVSNVGPGLGPIIGPSGTFESLPDRAKWICSGAMLLGRLEFVAVFVVLTRRFWRG